MSEDGNKTDAPDQPQTGGQAPAEKPPAKKQPVRDPEAEAEALAALEEELLEGAEEPEKKPQEAPQEEPQEAPQEAPKPEADKDKKPILEKQVIVPEKEEPEEPGPIVEFTDVSKSFGDFTAIKDINFTVDDKPGHGEFISILGPSGSGKSTVLRLIAGLDPHHPPTTGSVLIDGEPVRGPGSERGMVFQDYTSFDHRTVVDNVAFGLECRGMGRGERHELAYEWIAKVGLSVKDDSFKYPHQLSGGMRQRVAIARTLILEPRIILMDEPFGALDPSTRMNMQDNLVELWRELEATVFLVTHSIEEAVYLGDRIYILSSSPGTILQKLDVPAPDRPAKEMQRERSFQDIVFGIRETIEKLEASKRAGDD